MRGLSARRLLPEEDDHKQAGYEDVRHPRVLADVQVVAQGQVCGQVQDFPFPPRVAQASHCPA